MILTWNIRFTKSERDFSNLFDLHSHVHESPYWHETYECTKSGKDFSNLFYLHFHVHKNSYWHHWIVHLSSKFRLLNLNFLYHLSRKPNFSQTKFCFQALTVIHSQMPINPASLLDNFATFGASEAFQRVGIVHYTNVLAQFVVVLQY